MSTESGEPVFADAFISCSSTLSRWSRLLILVSGSVREVHSSSVIVSWMRSISLERECAITETSWLVSR